MSYFDESEVIIVDCCRLSMLDARSSFRVRSRHCLESVLRPLCHGLFGNDLFSSIQS